MEHWQQELEHAILEKLDSAVAELGASEVQVLDIGVFPWHSSLELSLLLSGDDCDRSHIANWPYYDYSKLNEGEWPAARPVAEYLNEWWAQGADLEVILKGVAMVMRSPAVIKKLESFRLALEFEVQVLNPDDVNSPNYCH